MNHENTNTFILGLLRSAFLRGVVARTSEAINELAHAQLKGRSLFWLKPNPKVAADDDQMKKLVEGHFFDFHESRLLRGSIS